MDTSKFFNRKISIKNPKTPYKKGSVREESEKYKSRIFSRVKETKTTKTLLNIRSNIFKIENLFKLISNTESEDNKLDKKYKLFESQQESENKRKKIKASKKNSGLGNLIQRPKTGAMDWIKNFVTFTFLGWLFTTLRPLIPKLEALAPLLKGAFDFLGGTVKVLINMIGTFIKFGYDVKDTITKKSDEIKAQTQELKANFDNTLAELKNVIGGTVDVATEFLNGIVGADVVAETLNQSSQEPSIPPLPSIPSINIKPQSTAPQFGPVKGVNTGGIIGYADGGDIQQGRIDPTKDPITRETTPKSRKKPIKPLTQSEPIVIGKDFGGEKEIKSLYGESDNTFGFLTFNDQNRKSGVNALVKTSEQFKAPSSKDILGIGPFISAISNVPLGQKPNKKTYSQFAEGLTNFVEYSVNNPKEFSKNKVEYMLEQIVNPKVEAAINSIRTELMKRSGVSGEGGGGDDRDGGGGGVTPTGAPIASIDIRGFTPEDVDALGRMIQAEAGNQPAEGKAAVMASILNRYRLIKSGTSPSQFGIRGKSKEEVTIRDIIFAPGQFSPVSDGNFGRTSSTAGRTALASAISAGGNDPEKLKQSLMRSGINEYDADHVVRSTFFSNPESRTVVPIPGAREVAVGNHSFQQSNNVRLTGRIGAIDATVNEIPDGLTSIEGPQRGEQISTKDRASRKYGRFTNDKIDTDGFQTGRDIELFGREGMISKKYGANSTQGPYGNRGVEISFPFELIYYDKIPNKSGFRFAGQSSTKVDTSERWYKRNAPYGSFGISGAYFYRDPKDGKLYQIFMGHGNKPFKKFKDGEKIPPGTVLGWQGASGTSDDSSGGAFDHVSFHVNSEDGNVSNAQRVFDMAVNSLLAGEGAKITKRRREEELKNKETREYDVIIPLDHHKGNIPPKRLWPNASLGAAGRERAAQDPTAQIVKANLEKKGLKVLVLKPEDYRTEAEYNAALRKHGKRGSTVMALHYDAPYGKGGTGFLSRLGTSSNEDDRKFAQKLEPLLKKMQKEAGGNQIYRGIDTIGNATMTHSGDATAALVELGSLVEQERKYGKEFWKNSEFVKHLNELSDITASTIDKPKPKPKTKPKDNKSIKPSTSPSYSGRLTDKQAQEIEFKSIYMKPGDPPIVVEGIGSIQMGKDFFGRPEKKYYNRDGKQITNDQFNELMKKYKNPQKIQKKKYGGLVYKPGSPSLMPEQKYASYNDPLNTGILAIQPIYITQPIPMPVNSGGGGVIAFSVPKVNNMDNYQQLMRG